MKTSAHRPHPVTRLPLAALRRFLRAVPDGVHAELINRLANHLLRGQALSRRLAPIEGRCLCLAISDTGNVWRFRVRAGRLCPQPAGEPADVSIRGELADFLLLATRGEDPDTLFFARRLSSATTVSLRIESLAASERQHLMRCLCRLGRYGDRITVTMSTSVRELLPIDWSAFRRDLDEA